MFYYQQPKRSPPSPRLVFLWRWSKAEGKTERGGNAEEKVLARSDLLLAGKDALPEAFHGAPEQNMRSRCFKEFDLLPLSPWFLYDFIQRCFFLGGGKLRELVSRFRRRLDVFPGCLCESHAGAMSITALLCKAHDALHHSLGISQHHNSVFSLIRLRCNAV